MHTKKRRQKVKKQCNVISGDKHNPYIGALLLPTSEIRILSDATPHHMYCDHMSLAASPTDNTPGVIHGALSMPSAAASHKHNISQDITPSHIEAPIEIIKLPDIPSPHNSDLASSFVIQVHVVNQIHPSDA